MCQDACTEGKYRPDCNDDECKGEEGECTGSDIPSPIFFIQTNREPLNIVSGLPATSESIFLTSSNSKWGHKKAVNVIMAARRVLMIP